jgi:hypothetical protein
VSVSRRIIIGPLVAAVVGFVTSWCVLAVLIRVVASESVSTPSALLILIVGSSAMAMLVAARARRNRIMK